MMMKQTNKKKDMDLFLLQIFLCGQLVVYSLNHFTHTGPQTLQYTTATNIHVQSVAGIYQS